MFANIKNIEMTHEVFQIFLTHFIIESSPKFTKALMVLIIISSMAGMFALRRKRGEESVQDKRRRRTQTRERKMKQGDGREDGGTTEEADSEGGWDEADPSPLTNWRLVCLSVYLCLFSPVLFILFNWLIHYFSSDCMSSFSFTAGLLWWLLFLAFVWKYQLNKTASAEIKPEREICRLKSKSRAPKSADVSHIVRKQTADWPPEQHPRVVLWIIMFPNINDYESQSSCL